KGAGAWVGRERGGAEVLGVSVGGEQVEGEGKRKPPVAAGLDGVGDASAGVGADLGGRGAAAGVGVGAPGVVDHARGTVRRAPNLPGFDAEVGLGALVSKALDGIDVRVDNDVNVGVLAERRIGAATGARDLLGVGVGA